MWRELTYLIQAGRCRVISYGKCISLYINIWLRIRLKKLYTSGSLGRQMFLCEWMKRIKSYRIESNRIESFTIRRKLSSRSHECQMIRTGNRSLPTEAVNKICVWRWFARPKPEPGISRGLREEGGQPDLYWGAPCRGWSKSMRSRIANQLRVAGPLTRRLRFGQEQSTFSSRQSAVSWRCWAARC